MALKGSKLRGRQRARLSMGGATRSKAKLWPLLRLAALLIFIALMITRLFFVELVSVTDNTMAPAVLEGDVLLVYATTPPKLGDVVLVEIGEQTGVRRVLGLPGHRLGASAGVLTRDEVEVPTQVTKSFAWREMSEDLDESLNLQHRQHRFIELLEGDRYHHILGDFVGAAKRWTLELPELEVPPGSLFLLCDNRRQCPLDERSGVVPRAAIKGVVRALLWYGEARAEPPKYRPFYGAFVPLASRALDGGRSGQK